MQDHCKSHKVWLVEDNEIYRKALARTIDQLDDYSCGGQYSSAERMLDDLESDAPEIILLDVQLPGINGIDAMKSIRLKAPEIKTVILTAFEEWDKIFDALCAGASGYLLKSGMKKEIGEILNEVMEGGAPMTPSVAKMVIQQFSNQKTPASQQDKYKLSEKELSVLKFMADGMIKKEIASSMGLSIHTVNSHIRNIYVKLHVDTNTGAVAKGIREKLI
jgi:DNA-binding NarL/FixJ family response regulator